MKYSVTSESESELAEDLELVRGGVTAKERDVRGIKRPVTAWSGFRSPWKGCDS